MLPMGKHPIPGSTIVTKRRGKAIFDRVFANFCFPHFCVSFRNKFRMKISWRTTCGSGLRLCFSTTKALRDFVIPILTVSSTSGSHLRWATGEQSLLLLAAPSL